MGGPNTDDDKSVSGVTETKHVEAEASGVETRTSLADDEQPENPDEEPPMTGADGQP